MIICHNHKFIFFKPLKTAGTSIEAFLSRSCNENDIVTGPAKTDNRLIESAYYCRNNLDTNGLHRFHGHTYPDLLYSKTNSTWDSYFKISCVRNPWDLCVSYYWWSIWSKSEHFKDITINDKDNYADVIRKFKKFLLSPSILDESSINGAESFKTTIDFLARESDRFIKSDINHYIRFENIQNDVKNLCNSIGIPPGEIPRFKSTQRKLPMHYTEYYDNIAKSVVEKKFLTSIEKFNYYF